MPTDFSYLSTNLSAGASDVAEAPIPNRRIGARKFVGLPVKVKPVGHGKLRARRSRTKGALTNVSVTGGAITCDGLRGVEMYSLLEIEAEAGHAVVRVHRVSRLDGGAVQYGVALVEADRSLRRVFHGAAPNSGADVDWRWMDAD